jgi:hypothetical protein
MRRKEVTTATADPISNVKDDPEVQLQQKRLADINTEIAKAEQDHKELAGRIRNQSRGVNSDVETILEGGPGALDTELVSPLREEQRVVSRRLAALRRAAQEVEHLVKRAARQASVRVGEAAQPGYKSRLQRAVDALWEAQQALADIQAYEKDVAARGQLSWDIGSHAGRGLRAINPLPQIRWRGGHGFSSVESWIAEAVETHDLNDPRS